MSAGALGDAELAMADAMGAPFGCRVFREHPRPRRCRRHRDHFAGLPAGLEWPYEWVIVAAWWLVGLIYLLRLSPREVHQAGA